MMLSKLVFPLHPPRRPRARPLRGAIWLPQPQAFKARGRGWADASIAFSPTSTFSQGSKCFLRNNSHPLLFMSHWGELRRMDPSGYKGDQESKYLLACLLVFPGFWSGRQTRGWGLGTAIGFQSSLARVPRHKLLCRNSGLSGQPDGASGWCFLAPSPSSVHFHVLPCTVRQGFSCFLGSRPLYALLKIEESRRTFLYLAWIY